ncbi:MAG: radical SAM protein [Planctomycetes bacterium]|nr:radical SAM protein [Planctomycetota bacterium]
MIDLSHYTPEHRAELESLLDSAEWQAALSSGLVDEVKSERLEPGAARNFIDTVVDQLLEFNEQRTRRLIDGGCDDEDALLRELSKWPRDLAGRDPILSFLGLNVTAQCDSDPRCIYCNQPRVESLVDVAGWKKIIEEVAAGDGGAGPYIYITGGEPLILGEDLWGDDGLVRFATQRGAAVNVNTNALALTPKVALHLIKAGLGKLHISLDASDADLQNRLCGGDRFDRILTGIYNVQLARDVVGASYPVIHTNCVLTNANLDSFPRLFAFILDKHKQTVAKDDPLSNDLFPHVIPVGGADNAHLRPSEDEFSRFYEEVWPEVARQWDAYQAGLGVPAENRKALFGYFSNPFLRIEHAGGLGAYVKASADGRYGKLALCRRCYVAPTQAAITPDGLQYRCGSHAIRRIMSLGEATVRGVCERIREGIAGLDNLPREEHCYGCALATLYINQSVESRLKEKARAMIRDEGG